LVQIDALSARPREMAGAGDGGAGREELMPTVRIASCGPVVRYGHWLLVDAFAVAYLAAAEEGGGTELADVWAGHVIGVIVGLRVPWGFIGPERARFRDSRMDL
jgi:hypothetical protein